MMSDIIFDHIRQAPMGWTRRLAESLLEQLRNHQLFMDLDVIPGVWVSRSTSRRQHWAGEPNTSNS
jgi:hypothetical protein